MTDNIADLNLRGFSNFDEFIENEFTNVLAAPIILDHRNGDGQERPIALPAVAIDGYVDTFEEGDLWLSAIKIIATDSGERDEPLLNILVRHLVPNKCYCLSGRDKNRFLEIVQRAKDRSSTTLETGILTYVEKEIFASGHRAVYFNMDIGLGAYTDLLIDQDNAFIEFAQTTGLNYDDLLRLKGIPIDYVKSNLPNAPTIFVYNDEHRSSASVLTEISDMVDVWSAYNPVYLLEGYHASELSIQLTLRILKKIYESNTRNVELLTEMDNADSIDRKEIFRKNLPLLDISNPDEGYITHAFAFLYAYSLGLTVQGIDLSITNGGILDQDDVSNTLEEEYQRDVFRSQYRSHIFLKNAIETLTNKDKSMGVMITGAGHYRSIKQEALERGDVNIVFLRSE